MVCRAQGRRVVVGLLTAVLLAALAAAACGGTTHGTRQFGEHCSLTGGFVSGHDECAPGLSCAGYGGEWNAWTGWCVPKCRTNSDCPGSCDCTNGVCPGPPEGVCLPHDTAKFCGVRVPNHCGGETLCCDGKAQTDGGSAPDGGSKDAN